MASYREPSRMPFLDGFSGGHLHPCCRPVSMILDRLKSLYGKKSDIKFGAVINRGQISADKQFISIPCIFHPQPVSSSHNIAFVPSYPHLPINMIRQAPRLLLRSSIPLRIAQSPRRLISTAPPAQKSRSWKSLTTRLGLAAGVVYFYNTSELFAEEPPCTSPIDFNTQNQKKKS